MRIGIKGVIAELEASVECRCRPDLDDIDSQNILHEIESLRAQIAEIESLRAQVAELKAEYNQLSAFCNDVERDKEAIEAERDEYKTALQKLACLGNGDSYGNSIGNCIAQDALKGATE